MRDRRELLFGVPGAGGNHRATERVRARFQHEAPGSQVIGKAVVHDVAGPEAGGEQRARRAPEILALPFGLEDRPRRHQQAPHAAGRRDVEAAERRPLFLPLGQLGLAQHRQLRQFRPRGHGIGVDAGKLRRPPRRTQGQRDEVGQAAEKITLARVRIAGLELIEMVRGHR